MVKNSFKLFLFILFIVTSFNIQAATGDVVNASTTHDLTTNQQRPVIDTKTVHVKPVKKSKNQTSSLGVFKLLIPDSLK